MKQLCWTGKAFKQLSVSAKYKTAGRNSSGSITMFHRGGGSTRLWRRIDFKRNVLMSGFVERIEYDPNRSARIALVRWSSLDKLRAKRAIGRSLQPTVTPNRELKQISDGDLASLNVFHSLKQNTYGEISERREHQSTNDERTIQPNAQRQTTEGKDMRINGAPSVTPTSTFASDKANHNQSNTTSSQKIVARLPIAPTPASPTVLLAQKQIVHNRNSNSSALFTYILACDQLKVGDNIMNLHCNSNFEPNDGEIVSTVFPEVHNTAVNLWQHDKFYQQIGNCIPLRNIPIGTVLHNIELHPGQGGKVVRAAGTFAQLVQKLPLEAPRVCLVRLPSGLNKQFDSRCRATIGIVSNPAHNTRKLTKAGQRRWLGKRPIVRGVAMNPVDHPHGGGEGRTKGGRPSVSPWGKPTKGGFKTRKRKQHN